MIEKFEKEKIVAAYIEAYLERPKCVSCGETIRGTNCEITVSRGQTIFMHTNCYRKENHGRV